MPSQCKTVVRGAVVPPGSFGNEKHGRLRNAWLITDSSGAFYGTGEYGGLKAFGTAFKVIP